ncbi:MAG: hypothetical protein BGN83_14845 [Rhizobium sp. 63-7]|nr:MAG: hypothetical protein BGN83_14845 [Rhizobium sp. 63-7]
MTAALARYLKDFSEPVEPEPVFDTSAFDDDVFVNALPEPEPVDPEAVRREAYAEGFEAATRELQAQHAAEAEAVAAAHQQELEALRQAYEAQAAALIATRINAISLAISEAISVQTTEILAPILSEALAANAVRAMAEMIRKAILDGAAGTIVVRGPGQLFDILKTELGEDAALLRHVETPDLDLTADVAGAVLVTRISAWAASLKKVLE